MSTSAAVGRKHLNELLFHLRRLAAGEQDDHHWRKVLEAARQEMDEGQATAKDAAAVVEAALERRLPAQYSVVLRRLEQAAAQSADSAAKAAASRGKSRGAAEVDPAAAAIREVAALLHRRAVLVIGGLTRPEHVASLREAFGLAELLWPSTRENDARVEAFEPLIARADVAVVLLLIRWSRHGYGEVATLCERFDKPLIRVPAGYNPAQLAPLILEQGGRRLREQRGRVPDQAGRGPRAPDA